MVIALKGGIPVRKEMLVFQKPIMNSQLHDEILREFSETLRSGWIGTGPKVKQVEQIFQEYIGVKHAIALNSCTAGLELSMAACNLVDHQEVITTPITFTATAAAIFRQGGKIIFADIDPKTWNIDPADIERKITPRTKAILPVHFAGRPCNMDVIMDIAKRNNLLVISDAAHAIETEYHGKKVGSIGDMNCFSFYATKNITCAEGGMITTDNDELAERLDMLKLHGLSKDASARYSEKGFSHYDVHEPGFKFNLPDTSACLVLPQLKRIDLLSKNREKVWQAYQKAFSKLSQVTIPAPDEPNTRHSRHLYNLLINHDRLSCTRDEFAAAIQAEKIGVGIHFMALHNYSCWGNLLGYRPGDLPFAEDYGNRTISLPISAWMNNRDIQDVITAVYKVVDHYKK